MKYKKTYCRYGLIEWVGIIHVGDMKMEVKFTGGSQTAYGVNPACFTTEDTFTQQFIEKSDEFKEGVVRVLRSTELGEEEPENVEATAVAEDKEEVAEEPTKEHYTEVEVADQNEAVEYLKAHYDDTLTATKLRTKSAFNAVCEQYQVRFIFAE